MAAALLDRHGAWLQLRVMADDERAVAILSDAANKVAMLGQSANPDLILCASKAAERLGVTSDELAAHHKAGRIKHAGQVNGAKSRHVTYRLGDLEALALREYGRGLINTSQET